ncbi:MAG: EAL domain-containing protein, partial [Pseudomonadota bacterium]
DPLGLQARKQEALMQDYKIYAALAYARENKLNHVTIDSPNAKLGIIASGKSYLDVLEALQDLGIDEAMAQEVGLRLTALIELGIMLAVEHNPGTLIDVGCGMGHSICGAKFAGIGILDASGEKLECFSSRGPDINSPRLSAPQAPRQGIFGQLLAQRSPVHLRHGDDFSVLSLPLEHTPQRAFLGVAIASREKVYGWLYLVDKAAGDDFNEVDERVVATIATQLAVAYENLILYEEVARQHAQLSLEMALRVRLDQDLQRFRMAMDSTADGIFLLDCAAMRIVDVNDTACRMFGYSREELYGMSPIQLGIAADEHVFDSLDVHHGEIAIREIIESQLSVAHKGGALFHVEIERKIVRSSEQLIMVVVIRDITERKEAEQKLVRMAHYDVLTGLPNRALYFEALQKALAQAVENNWVIAVLFIDLDRFKNVNDTLGHLIGDELLRQFGKRLVQCLRSRDIVGRLGGDEFALILVMPDGPQDAVVVTNKIRESLYPPFNLKGHEVTLTASIGITIFPDDAGDPETLIKYADTAMYRAKESGRDAYRFFTAAMNDQAVARLDLESALRRALDNDEFVLFYQPKINVISGCMSGAEALLRWNRPGQGLISPAEFIPLLEETGLIVRVGSWVIAKACQQIAQWAAAGLGPIHVAVNISTKQFFEGDLEFDIRSAVSQHKIEASLLELELTETSFMSNAEEIITALMNLKKIGVRISIDDFGTGYSSLSYLKRFPIDTLKIDIAFIREIITNSDDAAITLAIINMAHSLKLSVIAEGVENAAQLAFLKRHFCDEIQGYYFSRPLP